MDSACRRHETYQNKRCTCLRKTPEAAGAAKAEKVGDASHIAARPLLNVHW